MPRSVKEWVGKTDNAPVPDRVKLRVLDRQGGKCPETGMLFGPQNPPEFDHIISLINGGENRESNIQALSSWAHKQKTKNDVAQKAKTARVRKKHLGIHRPKAALPGGKQSKFKRKVDGTVVLRD